MPSADRVNDEFEVGFDEDFERKWYYAELAGRAVMLVFAGCAVAGLLGRGPFSHQRVYADGGGLSVDYEPVARHNTPTTVTIHVTNENPTPRPVIVSMGQTMIEPMGLQRTVPLAESSTVGRTGSNCASPCNPTSRTRSSDSIYCPRPWAGCNCRRMRTCSTFDGPPSWCPEMEITLRAAAAYWILLFAVRLIGRRTASQMAPFDLIVLFMFAGVTITAVLSDDHSMAGALSAICAIGLMHILVSTLKGRYAWFERLVDGTPVVLFEGGAFNAERMRKLRLGEQDVMAAARQRGLQRLAQVRYAVAERDGKISIISQEEDG